MKSELKHDFLINLQLFAEEGDPQQDPKKDEQKEDNVTFTPEQQAAVDRVISERLNRAQSKWEKDFKEKLEQAKTEAEKLAKMNADQKAEYERKKREEELAAREADITKRELRAQALEQLAEKGLPKQLADILVYTDADSTNTSLEAVEKSFKEAVEAGINERLRRSGAPGGAGGGGTNSQANPWKKETFNLTEQGRILRENPELAKQLKVAAGIKI